MLADKCWMQNILVHNKVSGIKQTLTYVKLNIIKRLKFFKSRNWKLGKLIAKINVFT
jgi:hypothetical protein